MSVNTPSSRGTPLVIRLRNWVGDVVLSVPTLLRLEAAGHDLHLVGKGWAPGLLAGYGWKVEHLPAGRWARIKQLLRLRRSLGPGVRSLAFPYAFSAALEFRLAGLPAVGFEGQCRSWLLRRAVRRPESIHIRSEYWGLGQDFLGMQEPPPPPIPWRFSPEAELEADRLEREHGLGAGFVILVPFASNGPDDARVWPEFPRLAERLSAEGIRVVLCPGGAAETAAALARYPGALVLPGVGMSAYGILMRRASAVVACDTGPAHLAAAAGARLISLFGPSDPKLWAPLGPRVEVLRRWPVWPGLDEVVAKTRSPSSHPALES